MNKFVKTLVTLLAIVMISFGSVATANAKTYNIDIKSSKFSIVELSVKVGDKIKWTNKDGAPHTATALDGSWTTKTLKKGQSETITIKAGMGLEYRCNIHRYMKAKLKM